MLFLLGFARQLLIGVSCTHSSLDLPFNAYLDSNKDKLVPTRESVDKVRAQYSFNMVDVCLVRDTFK